MTESEVLGMSVVCVLRIRLEGVILLQKSQDLSQMDVGFSRASLAERMKDLDCVQHLCFTRPLFILSASPVCLSSVRVRGHDTDLGLTGEIRSARLALSAKAEPVSVSSDPSTQRGLPFALLLTLIARKAQLTPAFIPGSAPEIAALAEAIDTTQILQTLSVQQLLLGLGTRESGLSLLQTTANTTDLLESS